ncbi:hypothetical protein CDD83_3649 [Cordyceps sp. RAO-2017]|nr:hypothetical protein CDD83_3649 [Cordyceps sp. RAO-2017]
MLLWCWTGANIAASETVDKIHAPCRKLGRGTQPYSRLDQGQTENSNRRLPPLLEPDSTISFVSAAEFITRQRDPAAVERGLRGLDEPISKNGGGVDNGWLARPADDTLRVFAYSMSDMTALLRGPTLVRDQAVAVGGCK